MFERREEQQTFLDDEIFQNGTKWHSYELNEAEEEEEKKSIILLFKF